MILEKIEEIKKSPDYSANKVYLIEACNKDSGFFLFDEKLSFAMAHCEEAKTAMQTSLLLFEPAVNLRAINDSQTIPSGLYDLLILKEGVPETLRSDFIRLCRIFSNSPTIPFSSFVDSAIDLFQLPKRQSYIDCIGLLGELIFAKEAWLKASKDLAPLWHVSGPYSKYDFSGADVNYEVKTTTSESTSFTIKHKQLFNGENNVIVLVKISKTEKGGYSLPDLIHFFQSEEPFASNVRFQLALSKELLKEFEPDDMAKHYILDGIFCFDSSTLDTLKDIPYCISDISYKYDFDLSDAKKLEEALGH